MSVCGPYQVCSLQRSGVGKVVKGTRFENGRPGRIVLESSALQKGRRRQPLAILDMRLSAALYDPIITKQRII